MVVDTDEAAAAVKGATDMVQKKKIIWWEAEVRVGGADEARRRGASEGTSRRHRPAAPYYGPVTVEGTRTTWHTADLDPDLV